MKNIIKLSALLLAVITLGSCKKYLDIQPTGKVIPTSAADFRGLLTTAYGSFAEHKSLLALRTDELILDEYSTDFPGFRDIYRWKDINSDAATLPYAYLSFYNTIFYANEVITNVESKAGKTDETAQIKGEAYLLRAYAHFELVNMYGKPYNKATASSDRGIAIALKMDLEQQYIPASVEAVYTQVLSDIAEGQKLLNVTTYEAGKNYRFTKRAALALEARVNEFKGEWTTALEAAQKALALNNQLEDLNAADGKLPNNYLAKENIMSMEVTLSSQLTSSSYISEHLLGIYDRTNDLRFGKYFSKSGGDYISAKGASDAMKISFRNGELYLIIAEAALKLDNTSLALESLFALQAKRLTPVYFNTEKLRIQGLAKEAVANEILAERERELALEGHRWYDLRRYGQPVLVHTVEGTDYTLIKNDPRYTLRFPQSAISANPNLQ